MIGVALIEVALSKGVGGKFNEGGVEVASSTVVVMAPSFDVVLTEMESSMDAAMMRALLMKAVSIDAPSIRATITETALMKLCSI